MSRPSNVAKALAGMADGINIVVSNHLPPGTYYPLDHKTLAVAADVYETLKREMPDVGWAQKGAE